MRNKPPATADANVMIDESCPEDGGELVFELRNGILSHWQMWMGQTDNPFHLLYELKDQFCVNDEFGRSVSHEKV